MAMIGDGTKDSPYLVDTMISFRAALQQNGAYIKVIKDLDCNAELQEWTSVVTTAVDVDLGGHRLLAPYVQSDQVLFNPETSGIKLTIHDGYVLGVGEAGAKYIGYYTTFKNIAMSCYLATCTNEPFYYCNFDNCNVWIKNSNSNNRIWVSGNNSNNNFMKNSRFVLRGRMYTSGNNGNGAITTPTIDNCLFEGELYNSADTNYAYVFGSTAEISNSVIDLTKKSTSKDINLHYHGSSAAYIDNTLLRDGVFSSNNSAFILCTPEEIRSVAHSDEVGFNVVEVKE